MKPPIDLAELLLRISTPAIDDVRVCRPFVASASELDDESGAALTPMWAIVHSVTSAGAGLFHPQPIHSKRLVVSIEAASGEVLRMILDVASTGNRGDVFETATQFLR